MYVIVWRFQAKPGLETEFEQAYGADGQWVALFSRDPAYIGTELLRDAERPGYYVSVDRWASRDAYDAFKQRERAAYEEVDRRCEALAILEKDVGRFEAA